MKPVILSSIWLRLTIFVGVLVIVTSGILIWTGYAFARDILVGQIQERLTVVTADRQALLLGYIRQQQERVQLIASRTRLRQLLEAHADGQVDEQTFRIESRRILLDAQQSTEDFLAILVTDVAGQVVTATEDAYLGQNLSAEPAFIEGQREAFLDLPRSNGSGNQTFLSGPMITDDGRALGVVIVDLKGEQMEELLRDTMALGESGEVLIGMRMGDQVRYLISPLHAPEITTVALTSVPAMAGAIQGQADFIQTIDYRNVAVLAAFQPIGYQDWGMVAKIDVSEAYAPIERLRFVLLSIGGATLLLGLVAASVLAKRFAQPIVKLAQTAAVVGAGDLNVQVALPSSLGELNQLAQAFNDMARSLQASYGALQQESSEHRETAEQLKSLNETLEQRTQQLSTLSLQLEDKVEERTKALTEIQRQLARQEKLAALGELAGSVAHELRNPLGVITNALYYLQTTLSDIDETSQEYLGLIKLRAQEMDRIIADLLHFRIRKSEKEALQVLVLVTQVITRQPPPKGIKVNNKIASDLPSVLVDPQQISQVLTNLVTNAYHAMSEGGELTFSAQRQHNQLRLLVTDTGKGMSPDVVEQVFEPLFTTKAKGIGLGLSLSKNLAEINGGSISVKSEEGQGSTFTLILPTTPEAAEVAHVAGAT